LGGVRIHFLSELVTLFGYTLFAGYLWSKTLFSQVPKSFGNWPPFIDDPVNELETGKIIPYFAVIQ